MAGKAVDVSADLLRLIHHDRVCPSEGQQKLLGGYRNRIVVSTSRCSLTLFSTRECFYPERRWNFPSEPISACHDVLSSDHNELIVLTQDGCVWSCGEQCQQLQKRSKAKVDDGAQNFALLSERKMPVRCDVGKVTFICHTRMEGARHIIAEDCGRLIVVGQLALGDAFAIFISRLHDDSNTVTTNFSRISLDGDHALHFAFASCAPQAGPERAATASAWAGLDGAPHVLLSSELFVAMFGASCSTQGPVLLVSCRCCSPAWSLHNLIMAMSGAAAGGITPPSTPPPPPPPPPLPVATRISLMDTSVAAFAFQHARALASLLLSHTACCLRPRPHPRPHKVSMVRTTSLARPRRSPAAPHPAPQTLPPAALLPAAARRRRRRRQRRRQRRRRG